MKNPLSTSEQSFESDTYKAEETTFLSHLNFSTFIRTTFISINLLFKYFVQAMF